MKYLIKESSLDSTANKILNSKKDYLPHDISIKILRMYLMSNKGIELSDLSDIKLNAFNFEIVKEKKKGFIYFLESKSDNEAKIAYDVDNEECWVNFELILYISSFFNVDFDEAKYLIGGWVSRFLNTYVVSVEYDEITTPNELILRNYYLE